MDAIKIDKAIDMSSYILFLTHKETKKEKTISLCLTSYIPDLFSQHSTRPRVQQTEIHESLE